MKRFLSLTIALLLTMLLTACGSTRFGYDTSDTANLLISFADSRWTGKNIPLSQICSKYNTIGTPTSPSFIVSHIPQNTDILIIAFNNLSRSALASGGGHGAFRMDIPQGTTSYTVPSIPAETTALPKGITLVTISGGKIEGVENGAYLPPCSGGTGNTYQTRILAINSGTHKVVGQGTIILGTY
ncbi:hypothetical protein N1030_03360 [Desulfovibrio mangrovi]|uniref:hypothetical protein n=1 Tax=Desulfovibrio mangrovi TaxID=2976983 RepID=UPI0022467884|nr:hypothetical protein [Desulfovibrio mangrovi]UZP68028.1 hypothetical protein N1030_03360 [Desulfovibrio mangrovi]